MNYFISKMYKNITSYIFYSNSLSLFWYASYYVFIKSSAYYFSLFKASSISYIFCEAKYNVKNLHLSFFNIKLLSIHFLFISFLLLFLIKQKPNQFLIHLSCNLVLQLVIWIYNSLYNLQKYSIHSKNKSIHMMNFSFSFNFFTIDINWKNIITFNFSLCIFIMIKIYIAFFIFISHHSMIRINS